MQTQELGQAHDFFWQWRDYRIGYRYGLAQTALPKAPMLLIHGLGASLGHWRQTIAPLQADRSVYAVDLLGFGSSDKPVIPYTIDLWVEQVYALWQSKIQQPIFVGGHSLGGIVALTLAARYPEMVKGLVLVSCADGPHPETLPHPFDWLVQGFFEGVVGLVSNPITYPWLFNKLREPNTLKQCLKNVYRYQNQVDSELVEIFRTPAFDANAPAVFIEALRAVLTRPFSSPKELLPQIQQPILVVWGQDDPAVPSFLGKQFLRWQPRLKLILLPGVGHCAHDELPLWVSTLIGEWITAQEQPLVRCRV